MDRAIVGINAKKAALELAALSHKRRNQALASIKTALHSNRKRILAANKLDLQEAKKAKLSSSLLDRLEITNEKIDEMAAQIDDVIELEDPIGKTLSTMEMAKGLELYQVSVPIGVIGVIFESRPDALVQISTLCVKSANAAILKGGSEAKNSNQILFELIKKAITGQGLPSHALQLIETREDVKEMLKLDECIDLLIPRGSNAFVKFIQENTKIPVLGHSEGICHVYVDKEADLKKAVAICIDAKCQYPAACNAMETLLVHKDAARSLFEKIIPKFIEKKVELRLDSQGMELITSLNMKSKQIKSAIDQDWVTEYNGLVLSIRVVNDLDGAIGHINAHGSRHTESIITENKKTALHFLQNIDASSVMVNASTRFADGFRYGKGAEVGISTSKIHARGPVGLEGLTTYKYIIVGKGDAVVDFSNKERKFTHKKINKKFGG